MRGTLNWPNQLNKSKQTCFGPQRNILPKGNVTVLHNIRNYICFDFLFSTFRWIYFWNKQFISTHEADYC